MTNFKSLKSSIFSSLQKVSFNGKDTNEQYVNQILTGILLYDTYNRMENSLNEWQIDDKKLFFDEYCSVFKTMSESLSGKYLSYKDIKEKILSYNLPSFYSITTTQINEILKLYANKEMVTKFSLSTYSKNMYNISKISYINNQYLERIHFNVMCKIVKTYKDKFNIKMEDVIVDTDPVSPGRIIYLKIQNIFPSIIYSDLNANAFNVNQYIHKYELTEDGKIKFFMK